MTDENLISYIGLLQLVEKDDLGNSKLIVAVKKTEEKYVIYNIEDANKSKVFNTVKELHEAIGFSPYRGEYLESKIIDNTGENIFKLENK